VSFYYILVLERRRIFSGISSPTYQSIRAYWSIGKSHEVILA